jgi:hypothetical protein
MALSDRIRPDCEAAPWVIKEVKEMESRIEFWIEKSTMQAIQISGMETEIQILKAENARYRDALEDIVHCIYSNEATLNYCEKKAREALKEISA